ncbi:MAG: cation transporter [Candidatus Marinimicrobia bacterium]|nr:cation transporter [Candidatus Neomarinimicrobiota bacterium]
MSKHISSRKMLLLSATLLTITFLAELIGGLIFRSLSLVSDSFHVISDLTAIMVVFMSLTIAQRKQPTQKMAFGYHRLEVLSSIFNGLLLGVIAAFILVESWHRFKHPLSVETTGALIIALMGLMINVIIATLFHKTTPASKNDVNIQSAYLHILGDILASISVVVGIVAIKLFNQPIIDPIVAAFVAILILVGAGRVLYKSSKILLHKSPQDVSRIKKRILKIEGVDDFVDIRLWQVCSHLTVGTAHVIVSVEKVEETEAIKEDIRSIIKKEFNIRDITLECETPAMASNHRHIFEHEHD